MLLMAVALMIPKPRALHQQTELLFKWHSEGHWLPLLNLQAHPSGGRSIQRASKCHEMVQATSHVTRLSPTQPNR